MNRINFLALFFLLPLASLGAEPSLHNASDPGIFYQGRVLKENGKVILDWSNTTVYIKFSGTCLTMDCKDSGTCFFNVWIDKPMRPAQDYVIATENGGRIPLAEGLQEGSHSIILQKRSEGEQGCLTINRFLTDGKLLKAADPFTRHIEFIGDSYTCGFGTEGADKSQPFRASEENCNLAYASITGRYFDAGIRTICHSGRGVVRNYNDADPESGTMVDRYGQYLDDSFRDRKWDASRDGFKPDIVVIYLGTNDFSCGKQPSLKLWCAGYAQLLRQVRGNYGPDVPVLCVASNADPLMSEYVRIAVESTGDSNARCAVILPGAHDDSGDLGSCSHPNYKGHRKVASCIIPYVATLTGWEMPVKPIE